MATQAKRLRELYLPSRSTVGVGGDECIQFFRALAAAVVFGGYSTRCGLWAMDSTCRTCHRVLGVIWAPARHILNIQDGAICKYADVRRRSVIIKWYVDSIFDTVSVDSSVQENVDDGDPEVEPDGSPNDRYPSDSDDDPDVSVCSHNGSSGPRTPKRPRSGSPPLWTPDWSSSPATTLIMGPRSPGSQSV